MKNWPRAVHVQTGTSVNRYQTLAAGLEPETSVCPSRNVGPSCVSLAPAEGGMRTEAEAVCGWWILTYAELLQAAG